MLFWAKKEVSMIIFAAAWIKQLKQCTKIIVKPIPLWHHGFFYPMFGSEYVSLNFVVLLKKPVKL